MPTHLESMAHWAVTLRYDDIPEHVRARTRLQIISMLAALHAARFSEDAAPVSRFVARYGRGGPCTVVGRRPRQTLEDAVLCNAAASMALDYDDYLCMGHTGHSAVLASWALAEQQGASTRQLLTTVVAANELGARLGASVLLGPQNGQAWGFVHNLAGAVAAARFFGLDAERSADALAIALYQPPFTLWPGFMGAGSKVLTAAQPCLAGIRAAQLAGEGLRGARGLLEAPRGFLESFAFAALPQVLGGLGEVWLSETLSYKLYPGCAYLDTAVDALLELRRAFASQHGRELTAADVGAIEVSANLLSLQMDQLASEHGGAAGLSAAEVNFSLRLSLAVAIIAGQLQGREMGLAMLAGREAEIRALAARVQVVHDPALSGVVLDNFAGLFAGAGFGGLGPRAWLRVISGYSGQMGGMRLAAQLLRQLGPRWLRSAHRRPARTELADFRMLFPVRVRLKTVDAEVLQAARDVPEGAAGDPGQASAVARKFIAEAAPQLGEQAAEASLAALETLEDQPLDCLRAALLGPEEES